MTDIGISKGTTCKKEPNSAFDSFFSIVRGNILPYITLASLTVNCSCPGVRFTVGKNALV